MLNEKICPIRSTAGHVVSCSEYCAWYADNNECAVKNVGNLDVSEFQKGLNKDLCEISRTIENRR